VGLHEVVLNPLPFRELGLYGLPSALNFDSFSERPEFLAPISIRVGPIESRGLNLPGQAFIGRIPTASQYDFKPSVLIRAAQDTQE
jgi:hypothetical protein